MEYGAIDLHLRRSQIRIIDEQETVIMDRRIDTTRGDFDRVFAGRPRMRILLESSTESEWVAQHLEGLGHEVIVADPNYAPMYGSRSRKVKTDKRDAAALAIACRRGIYRRAHRVARATRHLRQTMRVRRHLVQVRSGVISLLRSVLRQDGLRAVVPHAKVFLGLVEQFANRYRAE